MGQKTIAFLVAAAVVAPVCAVCILGPIFLGSAIAGIAGWFSGLNTLGTAGLAIFVGGGLFGFVRWRRGKVEPVASVAVRAARTADRGTQ